MAFVAFVAGMVFMAVVQIGSILWIVRRFFSPQRHRPTDQLLELHKEKHAEVGPDEVKALLSRRNLDETVTCEWFNALLCKAYAGLHSETHRDAVSDFIKSEFEEIRKYLLGRFVKAARLRDYSLSSTAPVLQSVAFVKDSNFAEGERDWYRGSILAEVAYTGRVTTTVEVETIVGLVGAFSITLSGLFGQVFVKLNSDDPELYLVAFTQAPRMNLEVSSILGGQEVAGLSRIVAYGIRRMVQRRYTLPHLARYRLRLGAGAGASAIVEHERHATDENEEDFEQYNPEAKQRSMSTVAFDHEKDLAAKLKKTGSHLWTATDFPRPIFCEHCSMTAGRQAHYCQQCGLKVHRKCIARLSDVEQSCFALRRDPRDGDAGMAQGPTGALQVVAGRLRITVVRATKLVAKDMNGFSDPYCILSCGMQQARTRKCYVTLEPEWNETFTFDVAGTMATTAKARSHLGAGTDALMLRIMVFDWDQLSRDDFIGQCCVYLKDLEPGVRHVQQYKLLDRDLLPGASGGIEPELGYLTLDILLEPHSRRALAAGAAMVAAVPVRTSASTVLDDLPGANGLGQPSRDRSEGEVVSLVPSTTLPVEGNEWEAVGQEPEAEDLAEKVRREEIKTTYFETLKRYLSDLDVIQRRLVDPLKAAGELPPLEERRIFANVTTLTAAVRTFAADLDMRRSGRTVRGPVSIGSLVKDHQAMLHEYVTYCTEHDECSGARQGEISHSPDGPLATAVAALNREVGDKSVPVDVLLRAPVSHLADLTSTVEALSAASSPASAGDEEVVELAEATALLSSTRRRINDVILARRQRRAASRARARLPLALLRQGGLDLDDPERLLVLHGPLTAADGTQVEAMLFDTHFVLARARRLLAREAPAAAAVVAHVASRDSLSDAAKPSEVGESLTTLEPFGPPLDLRDIVVAEGSGVILGASDGPVLYFEVSSKDVNVMLMATSEASRRRWVSSIQRQQRYVLSGADSEDDSPVAAGRADQPTDGTATSPRANFSLRLPGLHRFRGRDHIAEEERVYREELKAVRAIVADRERQLSILQMQDSELDAAKVRNDEITLHTEIKAAKEREQVLLTKLEDAQRRLAGDLVNPLGHVAERVGTALKAGAQATGRGIQTVVVDPVRSVITGDDLPDANNAADQERFRRSFGMLSAEHFLDVFRAELQGSGYHRGMVFLSDNYLCFKAKSPLRRTYKLTLKLQRIKEISQAPGEVRIAYDDQVVHVFNKFGGAGLLMRFHSLLAGLHAGSMERSGSGAVNGGGDPAAAGAHAVQQAHSPPAGSFLGASTPTYAGDEDCYTASASPAH